MTKKFPYCFFLFILFSPLLFLAMQAGTPESTEEAQNSEGGSPENQKKKLPPKKVGYDDLKKSLHCDQKVFFSSCNKKNVHFGKKSKRSFFIPISPKVKTKESNCLGFKQTF